MGARVFRGGIRIVDGNIAMQDGTTVDGVDISALATTVGNFGTMASQNANNVSISGGSINGTTIGGTTPEAGTFTTGTFTTQVNVNNANGIVTNKTTFALINTVATTVNFAGAATTFNLGANAIATSFYNIATGATINGATKTINIGTGGVAGSTTIINIGAGTSTITFNGNGIFTGDVAVNGGDITSTASTMNVFNSVATVVIGSSSSTVAIGGSTVNGNTVNISNGAIGTGATKVISIGNSGQAGSTTTIQIGVSSGISNITLGSTAGGTTTVNKDLSVLGNLTVAGTLTYLNTVDLQVKDKLIELNYINGTSETDITADGGGILLQGTTDKTWTWVNATDSWTSNQNINLTSTSYRYKVGGYDVIWHDGTKVATGTIGTGVWEGTSVALAYGGTNANLTAVNGGVVYSTATAMAITAAGTTGQFLKSNGAAAPSWSSLNLDDLGDVVIDGVNLATKKYIYHNGTNWVNASASDAGLAQSSALSDYLRLTGGTMTGALIFSGVGISGATNVSTEKVTLKTNASMEYIEVSGLSADGVVYEENVDTGSYSFLFIYFIHNAGYTSMRSGLFTMNHDTTNTPKFDDNYTEDNGTESAIALRAAIQAGTPNKVRINAIVTSGTWTVKGYLLRQ